MTSRERIKNLINRKPVDRIPNGLGGCETAGLHVLSYNKLKKILGITSTQTRMYTFMSNAVIEPPVLEAMKGDIIILGSTMCPSNLWGLGYENEWKKVILWGQQIDVPSEWSFRTETNGTVIWENNHWKCPPGSYYFDPVPTNDNIDLNFNPNPDNYNPSHDIPDEKLRALENAARWLYENTNYSICCGEYIYGLQNLYGGVTSWWIRIIDEPEVAHELLSKACEARIAQIKLLDQAVGKYCDFMQVADDMGDMRGVTIGPDLWRSIYKPYYKYLFSEWHKNTKMKISLHCCGSVYDIFGDLIECGLDIFNPVQISTNKMEPERLKAEYGEKVIFYGGCYDAVNTPPDTPAEIIYETVKRNINILSKNGGYIFAGVHNIPGNTPESHLKAIMDAYNDCCSNDT